MTAAIKRSSTKKVDDSKKDHQKSTTPTPTEEGTITHSLNGDTMSTITSSAQNSASGGGGPDNTTTTSNNNGNDPLDKTTACLPLVYGSMAFYLGKKADEYSTHRWTLYLRGPNNEDLSTCVAKAIFQLHPSFAQPVRELTAPPFEVTEKGWGEFEAQIKIVWKDPKEKPTLLTHGIKLYPPGATNITPTTSKEPVIAENYDEVVFTNPAENFYKQLMRTSVAPKVQSAEPTVQAAFKSYADEDDFQKLIEAQKFLEKELTAVKERMIFATTSLVKVEEALREIQEAKKASSSSRKSKSSSSGGGASKKAKTSQS
mmetsp:Transcript_23645/g.36511  ORF Transcript_23645/g.36511 Transcript_23645/m.36511 type:complete len:315 (+) Transcript_23645:233-1177(+)|eukprot:CAMPEP_0195294238 /NCGR_PEP_ID=MMETSP0707-20130614/14426_1 /TAXON_ID=33640 /ORGANISM="Asterionellopsis glacialis, Strain CCMP134" /LENGTH=314 /DNA_ID=CAMNT_0040355151 /DNA_START=216 /DNA_END=1160 /DNA_ORIENTATION=+